MTEASPEQLLEEVIKEIATQDDVAKRTVMKTTLDQLVGNGDLAYNGEFAAPGIISHFYNDHGVGANILPFNDSLYVGRPYGAWIYYDQSTSPAMSGINLFYDGTLGTDSIFQDLGLNTFSGYKMFFFPQNNHEVNHSYIYSIWLGATEGYSLQGTVRVVSYPTATDALNGTNETVIATSDDIVLASGDMQRIAVPFTVPANGVFVGFKHRMMRTSGTSSTVPSGAWAYSMLEEIDAGQTKPSKFVLPTPDRNDFPVNLLEANPMSGFIDGFDLSWTSGTQVTIAEGRAYVPGLGRMLSTEQQGATTLTLTGLGTPGPRYFYLTEDSTGFALVQASTTAPSSPYFGTARTRTGDDTQRFLGSIMIYGGAVPNFQREGTYHLYIDTVDNRTPLSTGSQTTNTNIDCTPYAPPHVRTLDVQFRGHLISAGGSAWLSAPGFGGSPQAGNGFMSVTVGNNVTRSRVRGLVRCNSTQKLQYAVEVSGMDASLDVMAYWEQV